MRRATRARIRRTTPFATTRLLAATAEEAPEAGAGPGAGVEEGAGGLAEDGS